MRQRASMFETVTAAGRTASEKMRPYVCAGYLAAVWLGSDVSLPVGFFDGVPPYVVLTPILLLFFLPMRATIGACILLCVLTLYEVIKGIQPGFVYSLKGFVGLVALSCILPANYYAVRTLSRCSNKWIGTWLFLILLAILGAMLLEHVLVLAGFAYTPYKNYVLGIQNCAGVFSEPSHLGIGLSPFVMMIALDFKAFVKHVGIWAVVMLVCISILSPSATLIAVIGVAIMMVILYRAWQGRLVSFAFLLGLVVALGFAALAIPEVAVRINGVLSPSISASPVQVYYSSLAFEKGREMAVYALQHFPLGVPFLGMSVLAPKVEASYVNALMYVLNSQDGSSLLFKGICEFGILFIVFVVLGFVRFLNTTVSRSRVSVYALVVIGFEFCFFAHFIRGATYFSGAVAIGMAVLLFEVLNAVQHRRSRAFTRKMPVPRTVPAALRSPDIG